MAKAVSSSRKVSFGKKGRGKATKSFNKHNSKSSYHKQNAKRNVNK